MTDFQSLHLFCRVVDNFGDIGVCWRLARQLHQDHGLDVTLWVDDLHSFRRICAAVDPGLASQTVQDVCVRHWDGHLTDPALFGVADIVVEAFACELPESYVQAMAARATAPVWINLEYLSAESWVEDCHGLPSRHPRLRLTKHFFFPGFSARTGGLLMERKLVSERTAFQADRDATQMFLHQLGVRPVAGDRLISLFCYPQAPVSALFERLAGGASSTICVVPEGVASEAVAAWTGGAVVAGTVASRGNLRLHVLPFVDQPDYDRLLWSCDLNFVRGEDSFVRAQLAARPFVWHIYPQDEAAHWRKLDAFMQRYLADLPDLPKQGAQALWRGWNAQVMNPQDWWTYEQALPLLRTHAVQWSENLARNGDLASNLVQFARQFG